MVDLKRRHSGSFAGGQEAGSPARWHSEHHNVCGVERGGTSEREDAEPLPSANAIGIVRQETGAGVVDELGTRTKGIPCGVGDKSCTGCHHTDAAKSSGQEVQLVALLRIEVGDDI